MKKNIKTICIVAVMLLMLVSSVYATGINMNMTENEIANTTTNIERTNQASTNTRNETTRDVSTTVSTIQESSVDDGLGLTNILNILIIVVGVVLILLAIAILIRLHA